MLQQMSPLHIRFPSSNIYSFQSRPFYTLALCWKNYNSMEELVLEGMATPNIMSNHARMILQA
jgi:hypothetical protein